MNFKRIILFILLTTTILSTSCGATEDDDSYADYGSISSIEEVTSLDNTTTSSLDITTVTDITTYADTSETDTTEDTTTSTSVSTSKTTDSTSTSKATTSASTSKATTTTESTTTLKSNAQNTTVTNAQVQDTTTQAVAGVQQDADALQNDLSSNASNGTFEDSDMILTYNGQSISVDMNMSDILALIGDPYDYQSNLGCYNEWNDEVYIYNDIQVDANTNDGNIYKSRIITILNSNVSTSKGIVIGSTVQDMENAYGTQYTDMGNVYVYTASNGNTLLFMADENGIIFSIVYNSCNI
ncbi:MAG: hypothetical protein LUG94_03275 [Ruminococcus sp.]|nr:hypothetical protein [Ruminococcus sp.]